MHLRIPAPEVSLRRINGDFILQEAVYNFETVHKTKQFNTDLG